MPHPGGEQLEKIKYERVPSLAMNRYNKIFGEKDTERFEKYIEGVAQGTKKISGATLLPSTLVSRIRQMQGGQAGSHKIKNPALRMSLERMEQKVLDGQWNTLVQRIKDSGSLTELAIAVCDVSGSMTYPKFPDGTTPMDSAIGLALLLAEVTTGPYSGSFITFSTKPSIQKAGGPDDKRTLREKVQGMESADWEGSTNFVAVLERLILPMAIQRQLSNSEMVKQIFVFSDMQFNEASGVTHSETGKRYRGGWKNSFSRIKKRFEDAGYDMPRLVFWNLAGGRSGGDAPKPVDSDEEGVSLVSGYSQALLKVFLDGAGFEADQEEVVVEEDKERAGQDAGEDDEELVRVSKKVKIDPLTTVKKAISHEAYSMLEVVD